MTKRIRKSTMVELVAELEALPPTLKIAYIILEAKAGEFHDYKNKKHVCGKTALIGYLRQAELGDLAERIEDGEFDEEADEEDLEHMRSYTPQYMWPTFGLERKN